MLLVCFSMVARCLEPACQKRIAGLVLLLIGPSFLKKWVDKPAAEVDLSSFNIVTRYDKPAIEKMKSEEVENRAEAHLDIARAELEERKHTHDVAKTYIDVSKSV